MTELWNCTDCAAEIDFDTRREHMRTAHGSNYTPESPWRSDFAAVCHGCHEEITAADRETFDRAVAAHQKAHGNAVKEA